MQDDRRAAVQKLRKKPPEGAKWHAAAKFFGSLVVAAVLSLAALLLGGASTPATTALFILLLAAGLWATEVIPAFAVALLVIFLLLLSGLGTQTTTGSPTWEKYLATLGSPLIWLFLGGFVLARGAEKTGLDNWFCHLIVTRAGKRPSQLLAACMATTFLFSMFISNTAATIMMVAVTLPIVRAFHHADRFRTGLMLGIAVAANLGGMATMIGSPPNAIAIGAIKEHVNEAMYSDDAFSLDPENQTSTVVTAQVASLPIPAPFLEKPSINFLEWMLYAAPPAILIAFLAWVYLNYRYHSWSTFVDLSSVDRKVAASLLPPWKIGVVMVVFSSTILLWITEPLHQIPVTIVSFLPICVLTLVGILGVDDIRQLRWDVLLMIAGGLSLGIAVTDSGLARWLVGFIPSEQLGSLGLAITFALLATLLSNFMSNTAAANILVPIGVALAANGQEAALVIPIALGASSAMALPISTPPNAVIHATEQVRTPEMVEAGILIGITAPVVAALWVHTVAPYL